MNKTATALGVALLGVGTGLTACGMTSSAAAPTARPASTAATPGVTRTVIRYKTVPASSPASAAPASGAPQAPAGQQPSDQNVTDPWAVVSAYYGDVESGNYAQAYALIGNGATTGQSYTEFADGFACTGSQAVSENWDSGDEVNFDLAATDSCTGATHYYTGTDTVENGVIVGADIVQAG